ncbi:hypothetical protein V8E51_016470 [Hyaloscypha variabilis]
MSRFATAFAYLIFYFSGLVSSVLNCYYPNAASASPHTPCDESAETSACCNPGDLCLSNGYCFQQFGAWANRLARGSCTDSTWSSSICPQFCDDVQTFTGVSIYLAFEDVPTLTSGFCCQRAYNVSTQLCEAETHGSYDPFALVSGTAIYNRANGSTLPPSTIVSSSNVTTTVTVTATASPRSTNITTVAAGIAVPLGVLLILATIGLILFWRKYRILKSTGATHLATYTPGSEPRGQDAPELFDPRAQRVQAPVQVYGPQRLDGYHVIPQELSGLGQNPVYEAPGAPGVERASVVRRKDINHVYR